MNHSPNQPPATSLPPELAEYLKDQPPIEGQNFSALEKAVREECEKPLLPPATSGTCPVCKAKQGQECKARLGGNEPEFSYFLTGGWAHQARIDAAKEKQPN